MVVCNYYSWNLSLFITTVGNHIIYLHIVNASSSNVESVQMGKGDVDFYESGNLLREVCPDALFISEVWQGHMDNVVGFWNGLDFLEKTLG